MYIRHVARTVMSPTLFLGERLILLKVRSTGLLVGVTTRRTPNAHVWPRISTFPSRYLSVNRNKRLGPLLEMSGEGWAVCIAVGSWPTSRKVWPHPHQGGPPLRNRRGGTRLFGYRGEAMPIRGCQNSPTQGVYGGGTILPMTLQGRLPQPYTLGISE